jgi:hypothetical protein
VIEIPDDSLFGSIQNILWNFLKNKIVHQKNPPIDTGHYCEKFGMLNALAAAGFFEVSCAIHANPLIGCDLTNFSTTRSQNLACTRIQIIQWSKLRRVVITDVFG